MSGQKGGADAAWGDALDILGAMKPRKARKTSKAEVLFENAKRGYKATRRIKDTPKPSDSVLLEWPGGSKTMPFSMYEDGVKAHQGKTLEFFVLLEHPSLKDPSSSTDPTTDSSARPTSRRRPAMAGRKPQTPDQWLTTATVTHTPAVEALIDDAAAFRKAMGRAPDDATRGKLLASVYDELKPHLPEYFPQNGTPSPAVAPGAPTGTWNAQGGGPVTATGLPAGDPVESGVIYKLYHEGGTALFVYKKEGDTWIKVSGVSIPSPENFKGTLKKIKAKKGETLSADQMVDRAVEHYRKGTSPGGWFDFGRARRA